MNRVFAIGGAETSLFKEVAVQNVESEIQIAIDLEKEEHLLKRNQMMKKLTDIILNKATANTTGSLTFTKFSLCCVIGVLVPFTYLCYLTLIPIHDLLRYPEYWYEQFLTPVGLIPSFTAFIITNCSCWMNISGIKNWKSFMLGLLSGSTIMTIGSSVAIIWWTNRYYNPVPFSGFISGYGLAIGEYLALWFSFPRGWRKNGTFRKRLKYFLVAFALANILTVEYNVIAKFLLIIDDNYQWIIALTLPIFGEFNVWIVTLLATKASDGDKRRTEVTCAHMMGTRHALFLAVTLGSIATPTSSKLILASDFLINLFIVMRLIRLKKKNPLNLDKQIDLLQDLILNEMVEFVVPLVYCLCFITAYLGPNSFMIGNVGNSYFQYNKIDNFEETIENIAIFFIVDVLSLLSNSLILWIFVRINVYKALCVYLKEYGVVFTINLTFILYTVSILNSVNNLSINIKLWL